MAGDALSPDAAANGKIGMNGKLSATRLPDRVLELVHQQEEESERLIGWAQLLLATTFISLFLIAPRPVDAPMMVFQPVPLALLGYAGFTLLRLFASYRGYMPAWLLVFSILLDVALVLGLVWYFHIQYAQPPAFSLKVPTFVYLFAFVSLRALRFDPRYVMLSGLFAALGWLLLVTWAITESPDGTVTSSFISYVNGNRILRGAEFGKIFSILTVTTVLSLAIWRARQTLFQAATEIATAQEMRKFIPKDVADTIAGHQTSLVAGEASERHAAIVMIDIRGFSDYSAKVSPQDVVTMLTGYHDLVVPRINKHGGIVDKFMGDGVMATFGAVAPSDRAARDALAAIEEIVHVAVRWNRELAGDPLTEGLQINLAAAYGPVVFATVGSDDRLEYTVVGAAANLAAKLEKHNKQEATLALVTRDMWDTAEAQGFEPELRREMCDARVVTGIQTQIDLVAIHP